MKLSKRRLIGIWIIAAIAAALVSAYVFTAAEPPFGIGSGGLTPEQRLAQEAEMRSTRQHQALLRRREEILREHLTRLEWEKQRADVMGAQINPVLQDEIRRSRQMLVNLLRDQHKTDQRMAEYLRQLWEAEGRARVASLGSEKLEGDIELAWPVEPIYGISAVFHDEAYEEIFHLVHEAIDIPVEQNSPVFASAPGTVSAVADNGMGYNYLILQHAGFATLYGHLTEFSVQEGQQVLEGQQIGLSGGQPGTPGAGPISTGPHVHLELIVAGERVDPLPAMDPYDDLKIAGEGAETSE